MIWWYTISHGQANSKSTAPAAPGILTRGTIMSKAIIIEQRSVERDYGFRGVEAIVEHEKHGRLLVCDGFGGKDSLRGGAVRFEHGMVCKLLDDDTFEQLDADWNDYTTVNSAVQSGYDGSRPVLDWSGHVIAGLAKSCGLD